MSKKQQTADDEDYSIPLPPPFGPMPGLPGSWSVKIHGPYGSFEFMGPAADGREALKQFLEFAREVIP